MPPRRSTAHSHARLTDDDRVNQFSRFLSRPPTTMQRADCTNVSLVNMSAVYK